MVATGEVKGVRVKGCEVKRREYWDLASVRKSWAIFMEGSATFSFGL